MYKDYNMTQFTLTLDLFVPASFLFVDKHLLSLGHK